jgi:inositol polyphosphate 5-phosphatase INPP5B/F
MAYRIQALDEGAELPEPDEKTRQTLSLNVASCLLKLLEALPEPLVPSHLHQACAETANRETAFEVQPLNKPSVGHGD